MSNICWQNSDFFIYLFILKKNFYLADSNVNLCYISATCSDDPILLEFVI